MCVTTNKIEIYIVVKCAVAHSCKRKKKSLRKIASKKNPK